MRLGCVRCGRPVPANVPEINLDPGGDPDVPVLIPVPPGFVPADTARPELVCHQCASDLEITDWHWPDAAA